MSLPAGYFDDIYAQREDPWGFRDRWYEKRKRALTLAALPHARYHRAFEPGCSIGELTADLAPRCDELLAHDLSTAAAEVATRRTAEWSGVAVSVGTIPLDWPAGPLDLIVLSEIAYYLTPADLAEVGRLALSSLTPAGTLVACHWRRATDYPQTGEQTHGRLGVGLHRVAGYADDDFLLDVWSKDPQSVAELDGLL